MRILSLYNEITKDKLLEANLRNLYTKSINETPKMAARGSQLQDQVRYFGLSEDGTLNFKVRSQTVPGRYHYAYIEAPDIIKFSDIVEEGGTFNEADLSRLLTMNGFRVLCSCQAFLYWSLKYIATQNNYDIEPETRAPKRNNTLLKGALDKHLIAVVYNLYNNKSMRQLIAKDINNYLRMLANMDYEDYQQLNHARQIKQQNRAVKWRNSPSDYMNNYFARQAKNHPFLDDHDIKHSLKLEINKYLKAHPDASTDEFLRSYFNMTQKAFADDMDLPENSITDYFNELGFDQKKEKYSTQQSQDIQSDDIPEETTNQEDQGLQSNILTKDSEQPKSSLTEANYAYADDVTNEELNTNKCKFVIYGPRGSQEIEFNNLKELFQYIDDCGGLKQFRDLRWFILSNYKNGEFYYVRDSYAKGGWKWEDVNGYPVKHEYRSTRLSESIEQELIDLRNKYSNYIKYPIEKVRSRQYSDDKKSKYITTYYCNVYLPNRNYPTTITSHSVNDLISKVNDYMSSNNLTESNDTILYRGSSSDKFNTNYGSFYATNKSDAQNFGNKLYKVKLLPNAKIFKGSSSFDYCKDNNLLNKEFPEVEKLTGLKTLQEVYDVYLDWITPSYLNKNPNLYFLASQKVAKDSLSSKGYDGAEWSNEDELIPHQFQIWNPNVITTLSLNESNFLNTLEPHIEGDYSDLKTVEYYRDQIQKGNHRPILINRNKEILDGNHTMTAYQELGIEPPLVYQAERSQFYKAAIAHRGDALKAINQLIEDGTATKLSESEQKEYLTPDEAHHQYQDYLTGHIDNVKKMVDLIIDTCDDNQFIQEEKETLRNIAEHHDESKYSDEEYFPYLRHFYPTRPEDEAKTEEFEQACRHHILCNKHHWDYWIDPNTLELRDIPEDDRVYKLYCVERVADWLSMAAQHNEDKLHWYENNKDSIKMPDWAFEFIDYIFSKVPDDFYLSADFKGTRGELDESKK